MSAPADDLRRSLAALDRRGFLRATGLAAAAGLLPTGCGGVPAELAPPDDLALRVLSPRAYATTAAAARAILGPEARAAAAAAGVDLAARADARLAGVPAFAGLVPRALLALEYGVPPLVPKWRPFTALAPDDREAVLARLAGARWELSRALFQGVRSLTWLAWYASPESHALLRYPAPFGGERARVEDAMTYDVGSAPEEAP